MTKQSNRLEDYPHVDLLYPSRYLKAGDLRGKDVTVTIKDIEPRHELSRQDNTKEAKPVVLFVESDKLFVMNKTNAKTIAALYGSEVLNWRGKRITFYAAKVNAFGKEHECLRIRDRKPPPKKQTDEEEAWARAQAQAEADRTEA